MVVLAHLGRRRCHGAAVRVESVGTTTAEGVCVVAVGAAGPSAAGSVQALLTQEPAPLSLADALCPAPAPRRPFYSAATSPRARRGGAGPPAALLLAQRDSAPPPARACLGTPPRPPPSPPPVGGACARPLRATGGRRPAVSGTLLGLLPQKRLEKTAKND